MRSSLLASVCSRGQVSSIACWMEWMEPWKRTTAKSFTLVVQNNREVERIRHRERSDCSVVNDAFPACVAIHTLVVPAAGASFCALATATGDSAAMLPVDGDALKLWLEEVALPKVSDADPAALSEYIVLLLDSIDLAYLDNSTKQQCVSKLREFFETHTEPFVDELFIYIAKHRQPAAAVAAAPPPPASSQRHSSSSASASHRDSHRRRSRSRSRSPSASTSRSRSRSRSADRDRRRRKSREKDGEEYKRRDRDSRDDWDERDERDRGRGSRGSELVRDYRFAGSGKGGDAGRGRDRTFDVGDRRQVDRHDYRSSTPNDTWQPVHHVVTDRRSRPSYSPPLHIQRPYVPPANEQQRGETVRPPRRTVVMPPSNPFNSSAAANQTTTPTDSESETKPGAVRVGHHTIVKRKRVDTVEAGSHNAAHTYPPVSHTGAAATLLLSNAPRFILNIKLLMEHFSRFGAILGIDIHEAADTATVKYGTAEDVLRALTGPPLHPQARLTVLPAQQLHTASHSSQTVTEEQPNGQQLEEEDEVQGADMHVQQPDEIAEAATAAPAATLTVGKHTITLKHKTSPSPPPAQPAEPTDPPAPGSALHTAQLIRQQKQTLQQQQQQPQLKVPITPQQPPAAPISTPVAPSRSPPATASTQPSAAPMTAAEKEHRTAVKKLQLLQAHIEQQERLMQRLDTAMASQQSGSAEYNSLYGKRLDMDMTIEETRRQWREARGKVVMLAIKAGNASATAPLTASATADGESSTVSASAMAV